MNWLRAWWGRRVFWYRFTHGKCVRCGHYKPMTGSTVCGACLRADMYRIAAMYGTGR